MGSIKPPRRPCQPLRLLQPFSLPPLQGLNNAVALDFDYREQMIYWTDVTTQGSMIRRMHINGSNVQVRMWGSPWGLTHLLPCCGVITGLWESAPVAVGCFAAPPQAVVGSTLP